MVGQPRWNSALGVWEGNAAIGTTALPSPLWIFGYGSLCWKADFPAEEQFVGRVSGWKRLFAQRSTDHRGTPAAPGLVATVLTDEQLEVLKLRSPGTPYGALNRLAPERHMECRHMECRQATGARLCARPSPTPTLTLANLNPNPRNPIASRTAHAAPPTRQVRTPRRAAVSATAWARTTSRACWATSTSARRAGTRETSSRSPPSRRAALRCAPFPVLYPKGRASCGASVIAAARDSP